MLDHRNDQVRLLAAEPEALFAELRALDPAKLCRPSAHAFVVVLRANSHQLVS
jgi:hypothetical protein